MSTILKSELTPGVPKLVMVDGVPVCVALFEDQVYAIGDTCTHSDASLSEGDVTGFKIECWLHGAEFDLRTGEALTLPANIPLETYAVSIDGNAVTVEI